MSTHAIVPGTSTTHIWDAVSRPPSTALKQIKGGRLTGMTDVNPQWRYRAMTETFGPCGDGWKYEIARVWQEQGTEGQMLAFAEVHLWWRNSPGPWNGPIPGIGGSMLIAKERDGLRTNDEGYKMAVTDALSVAMKMLGVAADIYAGLWDGSKYKEEAVAPTIQTPRRLSDRRSDGKVADLSGEFRGGGVADCHVDIPNAEVDDTLALLERSVVEVNAKAEAQVTNSFITEAQRKRLFGIFKQSGHTKEQVSAWLASGGIESSKQITQNEYEAICERLADPTPLGAS